MFWIKSRQQEQFYMYFTRINGLCYKQDVVGTKTTFAGEFYPHACTQLLNVAAKLVKSPALRMPVISV